MSVLDLARPHLRSVAPYQSARLLAADGDVFLDANESPAALSEDPELARLNRYPAPQPPAIVAEAARYYGVPKDRVVVTRGADEAIDLLVRAFVEPGREEILTTPPTYGVYAIAARLHGSAVAEVPLVPEKGFALNETAAVDAAKRRPVKLVFVCRPNNPTATGVPLETVASLCRSLAGRAAVVADEAYLEFCDAPSATSLMDRYPNLVVLKTLSKAWALAGARCGFLLAAPEVAALMNVVRAPYPISATAARAVESVFTAEGEKAMRRSVADILAERSRLMAAVAKAPGVLAVLPSEANFFLAKFRDPKTVLTALRSQGILVRDRSSEPGLSGCIRITVGSAGENARLLSALETL